MPCRAYAGSDSSAAVIATTADKGSANTLIYCDEDARWKVATSAQVPGNEDRSFNQAWYDAGNQIIYDLGRKAPSKPIPTTPICMGSRPGAFGQTYCQDSLGDGRCTITICQAAMKGKFLAISDLRGKDLANTNGHPASIDNYALTSTTILHEVRIVLPGNVITMCG